METTGSEVRTSPPVFALQTASPAAEQIPPPGPAERKTFVPASDSMLAIARQKMQQGELSQALHAYGHMIQRGRSVEHILSDLAQLAKKYPRNPLVWQALGDALVRAGDREHAEQSYAQARKLSR